MKVMARGSVLWDTTVAIAADTSFGTLVLELDNDPNVMLGTEMKLWNVNVGEHSRLVFYATESDDPTNPATGVQVYELVGPQSDPLTISFPQPNRFLAIDARVVDGAGSQRGNIAFKFALQH